LKFRLNGDDVSPDNGAVLAAYNVLVQRLVWDGWYVEEGRDGDWWQARLRRPVEVPGVSE
jgi:hypothetical protein